MFDSAFIDNYQLHITPTCFVTKASGFGTPAPRESRQDRAQTDGQIDLTQFYGPRVLGLEGIVFGVDQADSWDEFDLLKAAFALGTSHTLIFTRAGRAIAEQCSVKVSGELTENIDVVSRAIPWAVTLVAADPRFYSAVLKSAQYDPTQSTSGGGTSIVGGMTFPLVFSTTTVTRLDLTNEGTRKTSPVLIINGPIQSPIIDNDTLTRSIYLNTNLGVNDVVSITTGPDKVVLLNGASRPDLIDSQQTTWFDLAPGVNSLRLRGSGMASGQTLLAAQFRDARI